jgi:flagellar assembly protein FliH
VGRIVKGARISEQVRRIAVPPLGHTAALTAVRADEAVPFVAPGEFGGAFAIGEEPAARGAERVDVDDVAREAAALIDEAHDSAQAILEDARLRAKALLESASTNVVEIEAQARESGYAAGVAAGRMSVQQEMDEMLETMRGLVEMARVERHKIIESAEPEIVRLSMAIAERILHQQIALDRGVVVEMAKAALARVVDREMVTVRVNPNDLEQMREHRESVLALGDVKEMRIVEDRRVDRGGVVVETDGGTVDAKVSTQIAEARRILEIDDDVTITRLGEVASSPAPLLAAV